MHILFREGRKKKNNIKQQIIWIIYVLNFFGGIFIFANESF